MDAKLTLKLDQHIIEKAKLYAKKKKISLSKMIEIYLNLITKEGVKEEPISPLVEGLIGVIELPKDFDYKKGYTEYLIDKYK